MAYDRGDRGREEPRGRGREETSRRETSRDRDEGRGREESRGGRDRDDSDRGRSSSRSRFEYRARDDEDVKRRAESGGGDFDKILKDHITVWKPHDRDNRIRIVPPTWAKAKHYGLDINVHYGIGPDRATYLDLAKNGRDEADPITEECLKARNAGDDDYAKEIRSTPRVLVYLIDRDNPKDGIQAWAMPKGLDMDIVKISIDKDTGEVLRIDNPEEGYDVTFEKNGKGMNTKYEGVAIARRSSPLGDNKALDFAMDNPLPDQLVFFDYDYIAKVFGGGGAHKPRGRDDDRSDSGRGGRDRDSESGRRDSRDRDRDDGDRGRSSGSRDRIDPADNPESGRDRGQGGTHGREDSRARPSETPTWDSVHSMTARELEDMVEEERLTKIEVKDAKSDDELADWICEDMGIVKTEARRERVREIAKDEDPRDRLRRMRESRD